MKKKILLIVLVISLSLNLYLLGMFFFDKLTKTKPTLREKIILSEMVQKTIESKDYKMLSVKENIIAIDTNAFKIKHGAFPFDLEVDVKTNKQTYIFSCSDKQCSNMQIGGWTYSRYEDESPILPLKNNQKN